MTGVGFEPTPPERLVPKTSALDHSATLPLEKYHKFRQEKRWRCGESNPGPLTCEASALPLSYIPLYTLGFPSFPMLKGVAAEKIR